MGTVVPRIVKGVPPVSAAIGSIRTTEKGGGKKEQLSPKRRQNPQESSSGRALTLGGGKLYPTLRRETEISDGGRKGW